MANLLLGALFVAIWASAFTAARFVVLDWPPFWGLALRFVLAVPVLLAVVLWRGVRLPSRADAGRLALMGLFGAAGYLGCAWIAMRTTPSGLVALLSATAPLFVAAGEVLWLRRPMPALAWAGLGLGWLGVAVLGLARAADGLDQAEGWGLALALLGAVSQAVGILAFAPARGRVDAWTANLGQGVVSALALLLVAMLLEAPPDPAATAPVTLLALAWSVLVVGVGGYALYFVMLRRLPPASAAALQLLAPPVAVLFGWALLGERLGWGDVAGGLVTLAGLALLFRARSAPR